MKIRHFKHDYSEQLKRPQPKRYKGHSKGLYDSFDARYNNAFSIDERIARYNQRLLLGETSRYKHFIKFIHQLSKTFYIMKSATLNSLLKADQETVTTKLIARFGNLDYSVINWDGVDFSTQDNFRETFRLNCPISLIEEIDALEAAQDEKKREQRKALQTKIKALREGNLTDEQKQALRVLGLL